MMRSKQLSAILIICLLFSPVGVFASTINTNVGQANKNSIQDVLGALKGLGEVVGNLIQKFSDVKGHWAVEYVAELFSKGSVSGYTDGTFRPNGTITRAEFTKIMVTSLGEDPGNSSAGHWAMNYIDEATGRGYLSKNEFSDLNKAITRAEIARMISRVLKDTPENIEVLKNQITDFNQISREFQNDIAKVYAAGIITGYTDGSFGAEKTATRAEASTMLVRLLNPDKRKVPKVIKDNVIEIDGQEVKVEKKEIAEIFSKVSKIFDNAKKHTIIKYNGHDLISFNYVESDKDTLFDATMGLNLRIDYVELNQLNIGLKEHNDENKKLTKEILKEIFPTGYEKIYKEFEGVIYKGTAKSGKYDGRTYTVKSFPTETAIFIGGK